MAIVELLDKDGRPCDTPAWLCDTKEEAQYKKALLGWNALYEFEIMQEGSGWLVYAKPRRV